jgi:hypothetical protein
MLTPISSELRNLIRAVDKDDLATAVNSLKFVVEAKKKMKIKRTIGKAFHQNKVVGSTK